MVNSTHRAEVVPVTLNPHPDADSLSIVPVFGYTYVARTEDWADVSRAAYIPPDSLVDATRPEFAFLLKDADREGKVRIKARRLRGVVSYGLMVPVPDDTPLGEDWAGRLGVQHYEPPAVGEQNGVGSKTGGESESGPLIITSKYDPEAFRRYHALFKPGEPVIVTEKLDGANSRYVFLDGRMWCGSRTEWKREYADRPNLTVEDLVAKGVDEEKASDIVSKAATRPRKRSTWWDVMDRTPGLEPFCRSNPGYVVYGEIFGNVNCIKYGLEADRFAAFDVLTPDGRWMDHREFRFHLSPASVPMVPVLNPESNMELYPIPLIPIPYDFESICQLAEGHTLVPGAKPGTIREGVVVSPVTERYDATLGRVKLKLVSGTFLEKYR